MELQQLHQLRYYLDIILRWKKLIIGSVLFFLFAGLGVYSLQPKRYQASALLIYQRQRVNPSKMSPDVSTATQQMIATLQEQVLSRTNLEEIIKQFHLYSEQLQTMPMEDVILKMRDKDIAIDKTRSGDTFTVSYTGSNPKTVMRVANALATKFIEENLRYREARATETSAYVKDELALAQKTLNEKEAIMRDYKLKYYNEMPQQLQSNMSRLNALQSQYQENQRSIQDLERTKVLLQEQISIRKNFLVNLINQQAEDTTLVTARPTPGQQTLAQLEEQLASLKIRYTDQHPDVVRLEKLIAQQRQAHTAAVDDDKSPSPPQEERYQVAFQNDRQLQQLELQHTELELNMKQLKKERSMIQDQIQQYTEWINATPAREAEWTALTRDYAQLSAHYQELVSQNLAAASAESLERQQKGSQFKLVDSARIPEKPIKPNFIRIMLLAVALGLAVSVTISLSFELLNTSFRTATDLENKVGIPVIASIPLLTSPAEAKKKKIVQFCWLVVLLLAAAGFGGSCYYLYQQGIIIL